MCSERRHVTQLLTIYLHVYMRDLGVDDIHEGIVGEIQTSGEKRYHTSTGMLYGGDCPHIENVSRRRYLMSFGYFDTSCSRTGHLIWTPSMVPG